VTNRKMLTTVRIMAENLIDLLVSKYLEMSGVEGAEIILILQ
jgi:hypothetical protein